jgi:signal peptidase
VVRGWRSYAVATGRTLAWAALLLVLASVLYVRAGGSAPLVAVPSRSMEPLLHPGDLVLVRPLDPSQVRPGDVIAVRVPTNIRALYSLPPEIVHRVYRRVGNGQNYVFETKGDNNPGLDPFATPPDRVAGEVVRVFRGLGWPVLFLQSRWGLAFLLSLLAVYGLVLASAVLEHAGQGARRLLVGPLVEGLTGPLQELQATVVRSQAESLAPVAGELAQLRLAIAEYAQHLQSHTQIVRDMAQAAAELRAVTAALHDWLQQSSAPGPGMASQSVPSRSASGGSQLPSRKERKRRQRGQGRGSRDSRPGRPAAPGS